MKKPIFIVIPIIILILFITIFLIRRKNPDPTVGCEKKKVIWNKSEYEISSLNNEKIILKVENKNLDSLNYLIRPFPNNTDKSFMDCMASLTKIPVFYNMPQKLKDELKNAKGIEISIGIQKDQTYNPFSRMILNLQVYAEKDTNQNYDFDTALQDVATKYELQKQQDGNLRLVYKGNIIKTYNQKERFDYNIFELEGKQIQGTIVEFISKDNGKTWISEVVRK